MTFGKEKKGVQLNAPTVHDEIYTLKNQPLHYHRRSIRLRDYDYAQQGAYFVTICTQQRECYFENAVVKRIAEDCWLNIPSHFPQTDLDEWIIMPNHLHGILILGNQVSASKHKTGDHFSTISPSSRTLAVIIRTYKAAVTTACRRAQQLEFTWQRNYYEHIIRNTSDLNRIRQYILDNPSNWAEDDENPARIRRPL